MPSPAITIVGQLQNFLGAADTAALLRVRLCGFGSTIPRVSGTSLLVDIDVTPTLPGDGSFSFTPWGNDVITPGPNVTFYTVTFIPSSGGVTKTIAYQFTGSGTQDLSQLPQYTGGGGSITPPPPNAVVTNPPGGAQQTISGVLSANFIGSFVGTLGVNTPATSATPQFDMTKGTKQKYTLTSNIVPTFINLQDGQPVVLIFAQDGTGGRTVTYPANVKNAEPPDPTANAVSYQFGFTDGANIIMISGQAVV